MGSFRRQLQTGFALQGAAFDTGWNPFTEVTVAGLAGDERNELELRGVTLLYFMDGVLVAQLDSRAYRMTQYDFLEAGPGRSGFEDGEERADRGPRGEKPEGTDIGDFIQGEKPVGRGRDPERFARLKLRQTGGKRTVADDVEIDLVRRFVGRTYHGIRAADALTPDIQPRENELARVERLQFGFKAQGNQCLVPAYAFHHACLYPSAHRLLLALNVRCTCGRRAGIQPAWQQGIRIRSRKPASCPVVCFAERRDWCGADEGVTEKDQ